MKLSYIIYLVVAIVFLNILMKFAEKKKKKRQQINRQHQEEPKQKEVQKKFFDEKDKRIREQQFLFQSMVLQEKLKRGQEQQNASLSTKIPKAGESFLANTKTQEEYHQEEVKQHINDRRARREEAIARFRNIALQLDKERELTQDAEQDIIFLRKQGVVKFYHFTDKSNIRNIIKMRGLYSWDYLTKFANEETIILGGNELSRSLDIKYNLQNYVRLSFCKEHPMMFVAQKEGRIQNPIILEIDIKVVCLNNVLFSDMNATNSHHKIGKSIQGLQNIKFEVFQKPYFDLEGMDKKYYQAEVLVEKFIPLEYITNISNFI